MRRGFFVLVNIPHTYDLPTSYPTNCPRSICLPRAGSTKINCCCVVVHLSINLSSDLRPRPTYLPTYLPTLHTAQPQPCVSLSARIRTRRPSISSTISLVCLTLILTSLILQPTTSLSPPRSLPSHHSHFSPHRVNSIRQSLPTLTYLSASLFSLPLPYQPPSHSSNPN